MADERECEDGHVREGLGQKYCSVCGALLKDGVHRNDEWNE